MDEKSIFLFADHNGSFGLWCYTIEDGSMTLIFESKGLRSLKKSNDHLFFIQETPTELSIWVSDGTKEKTLQIVPPNLLPYPDHQNIGNFISTTNGHYFIFEGLPETSELWFTDTTKNGTVKIRENLNKRAWEFALKEKMIAIGNRLFFRAYDDATGHELWKTDGTTESTQLVWDIYEGKPDGFPRELTLFNDTLYFIAFDKKTGGEVRAFCPDSIE